MTQEQKTLIGALCVAITGQCKDMPAQADWEKTIRLAAKHGLLPLLGDGLQKMPDVWCTIPQDIQNQLSAAYMQAIYKEAQMDYTRQQLEEKLTQAQVEHIFLKGAVLKYDYPIPALRTMGDLDVLVYTRDFGKIDAVAKELEGVREEGDGNHRNYSFPGGALVEFHPNLLHHATPVGTQINPGWQYSKAGDSAYSKELTEEGLYLNTVCHLANHFVAGGVGVRFVLDVWVSRHLRKTQPDRTFVEKELERFRLLDFARNIENLAECWFGQGEMTPVLEELGQYILTSGSYGTTDRAMLNAVSLSPGGSRFSALMKKAFYPKAELEDRYPWCKGKAVLLPAAWCVRAFTAVRTHGKQIRTWSKGTGEISEDAVSAQRQMLARFGIAAAKEEK